MKIMNNNFRFSKSKISIFAGGAAVFLTVAFLIVNWNWSDFSAQAQQNSQELMGYAWSSNIGWISFNCKNAGTDNCAQSNYNVSVDSSSGELSGYAWSPNIGWISFNKGSTEMVGCPFGSQCFAKLDSNTGKLLGWARAYRPFQESGSAGGWLGWIHLTGTSTDNQSYGVSLSGNDLTGYAWGSDVMGWIKFTNVSFGGIVSTDLSVILSTNPSSGQAPLTVNLTAIASGSAPGNTTFKFDCENDNTIDDTQQLGINTANFNCVYQNPGTYTAVVEVERGTYTASDSVIISVSQQPGIASLNITPSNPEIYVGGEQSFSLIYTKDDIPKNVNNELSTTWQSDNESVATVNNSIATAMGIGNTTITGFYNDGSQILEASTTLSVRNCNSAATFRISPLSANLKPGETQQFNVYYDSDGECSVQEIQVTNDADWSSSNNSIATVDNQTTKGLVRAEVDGTATITASYSTYPPANAPIIVQSVTCQPGTTCIDGPYNIWQGMGSPDIIWQQDIYIGETIDFKIATTSVPIINPGCYEWRVDGNTINSGNSSVQLIFGATGPAEISVTICDIDNPSQKVTITRSIIVGDRKQIGE